MITPESRYGLFVLHNMQVIIKKSGIDQIIKNLLPELVKDLKSQKIDDITGSTKVAVVGEIDYKMTNITITNVEIGSFAVSLASPNVITVNMYVCTRCWLLLLATI